jgi:hypothetical protein
VSFSCERQTRITRYQALDPGVSGYAGAQKSSPGDYRGIRSRSPLGGVFTGSCRKFTDIFKSNKRLPSKGKSSSIYEDNGTAFDTSMIPFSGYAPSAAHLHYVHRKVSHTRTPVAAAILSSGSCVTALQVASLNGSKSFYFLSSVGAPHGT